MSISIIYLVAGLLAGAAVFILFRGRKAPADQAAPAADDNRSLFDKLGGAAAVTPAVNIFYAKVLKDDRIKHFFEGIDMHRQIIKQIEFLSMALGGPNKYSGADLQRAHTHLVHKGLNDTHFDAVLEHLGATLTELNVPGELIAQAAAIVESTRAAVLSKQA